LILINTTRFAFQTHIIGQMNFSVFFLYQIKIVGLEFKSFTIFRHILAAFRSF